MQVTITTLTKCLCVVWAVSLIYGEMVSFWVPYWRYSWPDIPVQNSIGSTFVDERVKVAVIADPQLEDRTSHGLATGSFGLRALEFFTDIYMRRSFRTSVLSFEPDHVVFLGDYFDGGPYLSDKEWQASLSRFKHVFDQTQRGSKSRMTNIPFHYISGNHDIGYAGFNSKRPEVVIRHRKEFGESNYLLKIGNVDFVAVDAQMLDGHGDVNYTAATWKFIHDTARETKSDTRVLLTHIPLYRKDDTYCGTERSSMIINQRIRNGIHGFEGIMYQNYLSEKTSQTLLELLNPVLVLSGHDHDQCTVSHSSHSGEVMEHTLGTFSWQQGNLYPSFMLLSVSLSSEAETVKYNRSVSTQLCFLPFQTHIYLWYASLFFITLLLIVIWPTNGIDISNYLNKLKGFTLFGLGTDSQGRKKEKDEDMVYDYDMIWDADGVMHLIPKVKPKVIGNHPGDTISGRGTAVVRPAAKKQNTTEHDSTCVTIEGEAKFEQISKAQRASRGKAGFIIQRLRRTLFHMMIIALFNIPLYIMLLAKDWS